FSFRGIRGAVMQTVLSLPVDRRNRHLLVARDNTRCLTCVTWNFHDVTFLPSVPHQLRQPVRASCLRPVPVQSSWIRPSNQWPTAPHTISRQSSRTQIINWAAPLERGYN